MGKEEALGMSLFLSFTQWLNIYEYLLCARSMIGPVNEAKPLPSWVGIHHISQL